MQKNIKVRVLENQQEKTVFLVFEEDFYDLFRIGIQEFFQELIIAVISTTFKIRV